MGADAHKCQIANDLAVGSCRVRRYRLSNMEWWISSNDRQLSTYICDELQRAAAEIDGGYW